MLATDEHEVRIIKQGRPVILRHAHAGDAVDIAHLLPLLGYAAEPHEIEFRLERMALEPNNVVLVVIATVVGSIDYGMLVQDRWSSLTMNRSRQTFVDTKARCSLF